MMICNLSKREFVLMFIFLFILPSLVLAQQEETNISGLLQSALTTAIKTFNSQDQPTAILQLNQIIDICQENMASREMNEEEKKILAQAYEYRGRAFYNIGETEKSQSDFSDLIKINPRYQLDSTLVSPKIVSLFDKIKGAMVGNLAVFSTPSGSEIYIKNKFLALTPMYSTELLKGEYLLEVKHHGFDVYSEKITILPNTPLEKEVTLVANTGTCIFYSSPAEVKIFIDEEIVGSTFGQAPPEMAQMAEELNITPQELSAPLKIEYVTPGVHRLELRKECFEPIIRSISVEIKEHSFKPFKMEPSRTSIQVNSSQPGASVYLNDGFQGITPLTLNDVCTGKYLLTVKKEKKGKWFQEIELKRGEPQVFDTFMRPTITFLGITNAAERSQQVIDRVHEKLLSVFKDLSTINFTVASAEDRDKLSREIGIPVSALASFAATNSAIDAKRKASLLAEVGSRLDTDLMIFGYIPEEKLHRHVHLELYSKYHGDADKIKLAFNDPAELSAFSKKMDSPLQLFQHWVGLVTIDTFLHDGIVVIKVLPNSPAQKAGFKIGDVLKKADNESIQNNGDFQDKLSKIRKGEKIKLTFSHQDLIKAISIQIDETPVELPRNSPNIYYNKALAELKQKILEEKDDRLINFYRLNLGFCYMHFNDWQKAIEDAFSNTSLPSGSGISKGTLNFYIAHCYEKLGYLEEAKKFYSAAAAIKGATLESNNGPFVEFMAKKKIAEIK
ncbi:PEGA domain-containing protein [candidate division CSSED10-310 bacterium]|uniref:PEGA domain-containing protein n=1 Tax=candidate division CSSED10-310 bacterium TaxID=2855610 RepID=A0ABV6Z3X2_UNCC1